MIIGLGTDVVNIPRVEESLETFGERFLARILTPEERELLPGQKKVQAGFVAKRFAAKEAAAKSLGIGFRDGVSMQDFSVRNDKNGKPVLIFSGKALTLLKALGTKDKVPHVHVSLSDDYPMAFAVVILS